MHRTKGFDKDRVIYMRYLDDKQKIHDSTLRQDHLC